MTNLYQYLPGRETDLLIAQLWARMENDDDFDKMFSVSTIPLSRFLILLAPPHETIFAHDRDGIWFLVWLEQFMAGTFLSCYVRPDKRGEVETAACFSRCLDSAIERYNTIINLTWQEKLIPIHVAMGYKLVGLIPKLFGGRDTYVLATSKAIREEPQDTPDEPRLAWCRERWTRALETNNGRIA